jgi:tetratricopeptide (TPR) repeat protein
MATFNQRLGLNRYAADEAYRRALAAYQRRDFDRAIALLNEAIEAHARSPEYFAARGLVHFDEAEFELAEADYRQALALNRAELLANYGLGLLHLRRRELEAAKAHLTAAYYVDRERPETLFALGVLAHAQSDLAMSANWMGLAHAIFEKRGDKRKSETSRWLRELSRHVSRPVPETAPLPLPPGEDAR